MIMIWRQTPGHIWPRRLIFFQFGEAGIVAARLAFGKAGISGDTGSTANALGIACEKGRFLAADPQVDRAVSGDVTVNHTGKFIAAAEFTRGVAG